MDLREQYPNSFDSSGDPITGKNYAKEQPKNDSDINEKIRKILAEQEAAHQSALPPDEKQKELVRLGKEINKLFLKNNE
jgi:hypothetical protein